MIDKRRALALCFGLYLLNTPESLKLLKELLENKDIPSSKLKIDPLTSSFFIVGDTLPQVINYFLKNPTPYSLDFDQLPMKNTEDLDIIIARFFMTGHKKYIQKMISKMGSFLTDDELHRELSKSKTSSPKIIGHLASLALSEYANLDSDILKIYEDSFLDPKFPLSKESRDVLGVVIINVLVSKPFAIPNAKLFDDPLIGLYIFTEKVKTLWNVADKFSRTGTSENVNEAQALASAMMDHVEHKYPSGVISNYTEALSTSLLFLAAFYLGNPAATIETKDKVIIKGYNYLQQAIALKPKDPYPLVLAGVLCSRIGQNDLAVKYLTQAVALGEKKALFELGIHYVGIDSNKAKEYLREYQKAFPDDEAVKSLIEAIK